VHREQTPPIVDGNNVPIWIRDGWSCAEKDVWTPRALLATTALCCSCSFRGSPPTIFGVFVVEADATQQTIDVKGSPTTAEGQEARQSMDSRRARALGDRDRLVRDIIANAKVFQGGGSEVLLASLDERNSGRRARLR